MLCEAVLRRGDFAYLGLIGSKTKRRRFERGFRALGIASGTIARLVCPVGGGQVRDKRPAVIAALTAAELLTELLAKSTGETLEDAPDPGRARQPAIISAAKTAA
jgi:xanthine dehydrogenase accessory factor